MKRSVFFATLLSGIIGATKAESSKPILNGIARIKFTGPPLKRSIQIHHEVLPVDDMPYTELWHSAGTMKVQSTGSMVQFYVDDKLISEEANTNER